MLSVPDAIPHSSPRIEAVESVRDDIVGKLLGLRLAEAAIDYSLSRLIPPVLRQDTDPMTEPQQYDGRLVELHDYMLMRLILPADALAQLSAPPAVDAETAWVAPARAMLRRVSRSGLGLYDYSTSMLFAPGNLTEQAEAYDDMRSAAGIGVAKRPASQTEAGEYARQVAAGKIVIPPRQFDVPLDIAAIEQRLVLARGLGKQFLASLLRA